MVALPSKLNKLKDDVYYLHRLKNRKESECKQIWYLLDEVKDPEIPVLSLWDLGIITRIEKIKNTNRIIVYLTPTYSGCPAIEVMQTDVLAVLNDNGYTAVEVKIQLSPAWSSNWISPEGRERMREYGIAPPNRNYCMNSSCGSLASGQSKVISIACPHCLSLDTRQLSMFGSTACKALHQCNKCLEIFDYFKSI